MTKINSPRIFMGDNGESSAYIMGNSKKREAAKQEARSGPGGLGDTPSPEAATGTNKNEGEDSND